MKRMLTAALIALSVTFVGSVAQASNVQDFAISQYDIKYELSRDDEGRSRLLTTETITAKFPDFDQNHGIERAIPKSYDGHSTSLSIESITKADGSKWDYSTDSENGNLIIRIGDADTYVHGQQTFVITYTQRDVTRAFGDTKSDEFYWDTNGTDWKVPIERLNVSLHIDDALRKQLTGNVGCYQGTSGSRDVCQLGETADGFKLSASGLSSGENATVAVGFKQKTFTAYEQSFTEKALAVWLKTVIVTSVAAFALIVFFLVRWAAWSERKREKGTIVPEYIPPSDSSLTMAASIIQSGRSVFTAQLLDFAVRHYIKILQTKEKSFWKPAEYDIEIIKNISTLKPEEQEILKDIFGGSTAVGQKLALKSLKNNTSVYSRTLDNDKKLKTLMRGEYGIRQRDERKTGWFKKAGFILLVAAGILLSPPLLVASGVAFICAYTLWPLTDRGLALSRYMDGLKMYIKVAETERLKLLQSPDGAQKVGVVDTNDPNQLVKLYEQVLPYAALFGQEKEWAKRIGDIYESSNTRPSWYAGNNTVFNAAVFSSAMNGFGTAASYSSASSSSSGGSSGGGSSGGGGGGGGGGGW